MQNLKKNWFVLKRTRIWRILTQGHESLENLHFDWFLFCKVCKVWHKKVQRSYLTNKWKVSKYGVISGPCFPVFRPEITPYLDTFQRNYRGIILQRDYMSWQWRMMQNLERNWLAISIFTWGIWQILIWAIKSLKDLHFNGLFFTKYTKFKLKKVQRSYIDSIDDWCKIWRKNDLCFQKWHEEIGNFSQAEK